MRKYYLTALLSLICLPAFSQEYDPSKVWSLKDVVEYAFANSVQVQSKEIASENKSIDLQTAQLSRLPSLNASIGEDLSFGRSQNREGVTQDQSSYNTSLGVSASVPVFEGFSINNKIKSEKFNLAATELDTEQAKQDLTIRITSLYLQVLFSKEALKIAGEQVEINRKLVSDTKAMVEAGKKSESELYNAESSLANSESNMVEAENACQSAMLDLVQAINYPDYRGFQVIAPDTKAFLADAMYSLTPADSLYDSYLLRRPSVLAAENRLKAAESNVKVAQSNYWPSISLGVSYGNGYYGSKTSDTAFLEQLRNNGRTSVGMTMNIPIFNKMAIRNSVRTAKNSARLQELSLRQSKLDAVKEVQTAYVNASSAQGKYEAGIKTLEAARKAFEFEQKKFESGRSTAYQFDEMRQKYASAELQQLQAEYTFVLRAKILDFYKGNPLY